MARGAPWYSGGQFHPDRGLPLQERAQQMPQAGMFGAQPQRRGFGSKIADFVLALGAANGNPLGTLALRQRGEMQEQRAQAEARERARLTGIEDQFGLWRRQQQYGRENPGPSALEQQAAYYRSIGRADLAEAFLLNSANPIQSVPYTNEQGQQGIQFIRPPLPQAGRSSAPPVLTELPPDAEPIAAEPLAGESARGPAWPEPWVAGGGVGSGQRNFRR